MSPAENDPPEHKRMGDCRRLGRRSPVSARQALWLVFRKRPTAEELERARRQFLVQSGRLVDGMLLDIYEVDAEDGRTLTMLLFNYRIGGVDYECSQDITDMRGVCRCGAGARRLSLLGALPARQSRITASWWPRMDRPARRPAATCPPSRIQSLSTCSHLQPGTRLNSLSAQLAARYPTPVTLGLMHVHAAPAGKGANRTTIRAALLAGGHAGLRRGHLRCRPARPLARAAL